MNDVVIVAATRTAIGKFGGSLGRTAATELGTVVIREALQRAMVEGAQIDEVIMGQVLQANCGANPARQSAIHAGVPEEIPATTINNLCGSGLRAVTLAAQAIRAGDAEAVVAGGQECMSMAPHILPNSRGGTRMGDWKLLDSMMRDALIDPFFDYHVGVTAENIATEWGISRETQDAIALLSQQKASEAQRAGFFRKEIVPVLLARDRGDPIAFDQDEFISRATTSEGLASLKPAFKKFGTVTAGNASGVNDGAAAVVLMSARRAERLGCKPLARIASYASSGVEPALMGMGPVTASKKALALAGWRHTDLDLIEVNEAFAAQAWAVDQEMGWDTAKVNVNGGAIALGHPVGASGCRILVTLIHEMIRRDVKRGLASLCVGGGMGVAVTIER